MERADGMGARTPTLDGALELSDVTELPLDIAHHVLFHVR